MSFSKVKGSNTPTNALLIPNNLSDVANANTSLNNILPNQTGNVGKAIVTNGTNASWQTVSGAADSDTTAIAANDIVGDLFFT